MNLGTETTLADGKLTCEELVETKLNDRLEDLLFDPHSVDEDDLRARLVDDGLICDDDYLSHYEMCDVWRDSLLESVMSVSEAKVYTVALSYGGPSDEFELIRENGEWTGGAYVYKDWFDGARRAISAEQAESIADALGVWLED